jgi:hypothetical protein
MNRIAISGLFVVGLTATLVTAQQKIANPKAETSEAKIACALSAGPSDQKALLEIDHAWGEAEEKQAPAPTAPPPAHEMQRLTNMLAGRWSISQVFEPGGGMPAGVVGQGREVWRPLLARGTYGEKIMLWPRRFLAMHC